MKVITERGEYLVDEVSRGEFSVKMLACTCEDQTQPTMILCSTGRVQLHVCNHVGRGGALWLSEIHLGIGLEFSFNMSSWGPPAIPYQTLENCCRLNRIVEIIP